MKKSRFLFFVILLLPTVALLIAIIIHKGDVAPMLITASQFHQTQAAWTNQVYVRIDTNAEFANRIHDIRLVDNNVHLSPIEFESLRRATENLVFANYMGDYERYREFRTPIPSFEPPSDEIRSGWEAWFRILFPNDQIPVSFDDINKKIWVKVYGGHHYWTDLGMDKSEISLMATNKFPGLLTMNLQDSKNVHCMESVSPGTYSYNAILEKNLVKNHQLKIAKLLFWATTIDPVNKPRPFLYVMILDTDSSAWLPIEVAQCSTADSKYPIPF